MKILLRVLLLSSLAMPLAAEETRGGAGPAALPKIGTLEATNYYDKEVIVTGKVAQVTIRPSVTFLNLDRPFPNSPFTVTIFHGHSQFYGDANLLKGKAIEVRGKVKNFKDKPEIALDFTNQLTVIGVTNLNIFVAPPRAATPTNAPDQATNFPEIM